jgi:hypothetical protein
LLHDLFKRVRLDGRAPLLDSAIIFLFACALIGPLFLLEYLDNWASIECTFITDARVIREQLPHPSWLAIWYCGTRFDYIYPPALQYGAALLSLCLGISPARAYHLYSALFYGLGIAGVYWLAYAGTRSRRQAWFAAICTALLSPSFTLMADLRNDSPFRVPQRLHVLMSYGEGPHISSLSILGLALAVSFVALRRWRPITAFVAASILSAAVVATNFYGATALAIFFSILTWAVFVTERQAGVLMRAAGIAATAYGLCAFWFTPSYLRITQHNMKWVAMPGKKLHIAAASCLAALFCLVTFYISKRWGKSPWPIFLWGSVIFLAVYVLGWYHFQFSVMGNALRLAPELDLALILLATHYLAIAWRRPMLRSGIVVLLYFVLSPSAKLYLRHAWTIFPRATDVRERPEYQIPKWMSEHMPGARAFPGGSIRFWYDTWNNNSQIYGGSNQGMMNQILPAAVWQIVHGDKADLAIAWLQALGTDVAVVPDNRSQEVYHEYAHPEKFKGVLEALYDDHKGNVIYRVPRRFPAFARVVERSRLAGLGPPKDIDDMATLTRYLDAIEHGPDSPITFKRPNFQTIELAASTTSSHAVLLQETFDPAWRAYSEGRPLTIERDPVMGFMLIHTFPGANSIQIRFETPFENRVGQVLTILTCMFLVALCCYDVAVLAPSERLMSQSSFRKD